MSDPILFQLDNTFKHCKKNCLKKLMKEQEFKGSLQDLFKHLVTFNDPSPINDLVSLTQGIVSFLSNVSDSDKQRLIEISNIHNDPNDKFKQWQKFFHKLREEHAEEIDNKLWRCYLAKQKKLAGDPSSAFNNEAFEGLVCQYLTDFLKRAGAMLYELISNYTNGFVYTQTEGQKRLFTENEGDVKSGKEQLQEYYRNVTGSGHAPPASPTPPAP